VSPAAGDRRIAAARLWASAQAPYLASALFASSVQIEPDAGTIAIDRSWQIRADPTILDTLSVPELGRLLIHLCAHLIRDHAGRARAQGVQEENGRAPWNRAADAEINDDLAAESLMPACACDRPADLGCDEGQLTEHYYTAQTPGPRRWDCGSGADGCDRPGDGRGKFDPRQGELLRLKVAADIHARPPGTVPGGWQRWAESVLPSRTDWRRALAAEVRRGITYASGAVDYSYRKPARRSHLNDDLILPSLVRPIPEIAIVCDTSGSMHEQLLARALAEVEAVLTRAGLRRGRVPVLAVDTAVHAVRRVTRAHQVTLAGGGGTDMGQGIAAASALRPRPAVIIVLTDGYTPWPAEPPPGSRVIVGLLVEGGGPGITELAGPDWARTILIDEP
jgi:predicted metal-dependent peptidase